MMRFTSAALFALALEGCAGRLPLPALDQVDRMRTSQEVAATATIAPDAFARAEQARLDAHTAHAAGDDVAATLDAERATAAYADAMAASRAARATLETIAAQGALDTAMASLQSLVSSRATLEADLADLEKVALVAQQRLDAAPSAPATPEREAARRTASAALLTEARLICGSARLVSENADGLSAAETALQSFDKARSEHASAAIDAAAQCRVSCLDVLVRARRSSGDAVARIDQLFAELSAVGSWDPRSDERGVVVTLRDAYRGAQLTDDGAHRLAELGSVAAAHPSFGVQVVVHDSAPPASDQSDSQRAQSAVKALVAGGASSSHIASELAGARAPVADPGDARARGRNERLEVVFVAR
jgi:hypothetical protein